MTAPSGATERRSEPFGSSPGFRCPPLAREVGISQPHLSNIEPGDRQPSPAVLIKLAEALKVKLPAILADPEPSWLGPQPIELASHLVRLEANMQRLSERVTALEQYLGVGHDHPGRTGRFDIFARGHVNGDHVRAGSDERPSATQQALREAHGCKGRAAQCTPAPTRPDRQIWRAARRGFDQACPRTA